jgi:hypothetical protein
MNVNEFLKKVDEEQEKARQQYDFRADADSRLEEARDELRREEQE